MNLKALYEDVRRIMPTGYFCLKLEVWQYDDQDARPPEVTISIYDGNEHFKGPTPDVALALLAAKHRPLTSLDIVQAVEVPD